MKRIALLLLAVLLAVSAFGAGAASGDSGGAAEPAGSKTGITTLDELAEARIGVQVGTTEGKIVEARYPEAAVSYFNNTPDMVVALLKNKIDAFTISLEVLGTVIKENNTVTYIQEPLHTYDCGFAFARTEQGMKLQEEFNTFLRGIKADGTLQEAEKKWIEDLEQTPVQYKQLPASNGKLRMAMEAIYPPFEFVSNGQYTGLDVEIAARFCEAYGYGLEIVDMSFDAVIPSIQTGKCDFIGSGLEITAERGEMVLFSDSYHTVRTVMAVLKESAEQAPETAGAPGQDSGTEGRFTRFEELEHSRIGVVSGSIQGPQAEERFPEAQLFYFNTDVDMLGALRTNKIDAFATAEALLRKMMESNEDLTKLDGWLGEGMKTAAIFPKTDRGAALCDEYSAFIRQIRESGVYDEIQETWKGTDETKHTIPDLLNLPGEKGTLRMAADTSLVPYVYIKDGLPAGIEVDIAVRFCKEYGYGLEVIPMDFSGIIPAVLTGKVDFAGSCVAITAERAESVLFSEPTNESGSVVAVLKTKESAAAAAKDESSENGIIASFEKTFLREDRWKLFADGVGNTMLITLLSILFGTALGFLVFMACRNGNAAANGISRFAMWLVQGMPMVVLLMILYYIIFGSSAISGIAVAVIGFTLTFGSSVFGMLKMGVNAVDRGQFEAACALGYSNRRTFFKIILPQAIPHVLPAYQGEIVGLIKATAVVGYIAVQDLTKMGDIVRSRTYEAFFPLIAITVIYFVLEGLFSMAVGRIRIRINPRQRSRESILKGVKIHDQD